MAADGRQSIWLGLAVTEDEWILEGVDVRGGNWVGSVRATPFLLRDA